MVGPGAAVGGQASLSISEPFIVGRMERVSCPVDSCLRCTSSEEASTTRPTSTGHRTGTGRVLRQGTGHTIRPALNIENQRIKY